MHKQLKQIVTGIGRKKILLFVLIFSMVLLGAAIYGFAKQNNWLEDEFAKKIKNNDLNNELAKLSLYIKNAESANRGYAISGNRKYVENFDAGIDSIRAMCKQVQQLVNRNEYNSDLALFLKSDSLIEQKIAFMQRVKSLCDNHDCNTAVALIASNEGLHLSDSIAKINKQISENFQVQLKIFQTKFLKISSRNNNIAYSGIVASMILIVIVFHLLIVEIRKAKKINEELFVRKENYRVTLNSLGEGLISTDRDGNIQYMNIAAERLTGWSWQDAKNQPLQKVYDVVNQETGRPFENIVSRILKEGGTIGHENNTLLKAKNSGTFIINNNGSAILDINGNISGAVLVFNDITEKYKTEKELKENEKQYISLIQNLPEAVYTCDASGYIQLYNKAAVKLWGREPIAGKDLWCGSWKTFNTDGTDLTLESCPLSLTLKEGRPVHGKEVMVQLPDESYRHVLPYPSPLFNAEGQLTGAINIMIDITDNKEREILIQKTEEKYHKLFEQASDAILIYSFDGTIHEFNKSCFTLLGYSREEFAKLKLTDILVDDIIMNQENYAAILAGDTKTVYRHLMRKDGSLIETEVTVKMLEDGKAIAFARDITERKKAEEDLRMANQRLTYHLNNSPLAIIEWDKNFMIRKWSVQAEKIFGWKETEVVNKHFNDFNLVFEEDAPAVAIIANELMTGAANSNKCLNRNHTKSGKVIHCQWFNSVLKDEEGNIQSILSLIQDITEQEKAERQIIKEKEFSDTIINSLPGVFYLLDENVNFLRWNKNFETATGYNATEIAGMHPLDFFDKDEKELIEEKIEEVFTKGEVNVETSFYTKEHKKIPYYLTGFMIEYEGKIHLIGVGIDNTERKKAEDALAQSENHLRTIVQAEPECVKLLDINGCLEDMNTAGLAMLEADNLQQVQGKSVLGIICEPYRKAFERLTKDVFKGIPGTLEFEITGIKGTHRWLETHAVPLKSAEGKIISLLSVTRDITEHKKAELVIKKEKELSDSIINSLPGVFYFYDENLKLLRWNKQLENVTGYSAAELGSMNPIAFFDGEDRKHMQERSRKVFASGSGDAEANFTTKAGKKIPFYFTGLRMQYDGKPSLLGIGIDITERKNAETKTKSAIERYDILARATSDTIWDWDIVNNRMLYNEGITKMFGYVADEVENVVDWWNEKLHTDDFQKVAWSLNDIFEKGLQRFQLTYRFRCADGSYKHIFDRAFVVFDENGKPCRIIGAMQDITYQVEEEIRITKATLDAQEQERRFIGAELHDNVNQILAGSLLVFDMVKAKQTDKGRSVELIETGKGYITDAINEVRKLSHELAPASFDDSSLKDAFENLLWSINLNNQFNIQFDFDESGSIINDDIQINLYRILQEQTKNIIKHAEASAIEIAVTLSANTVSLRIFDNGKGFNTMTSKKGIGLSNIKKRAESLSGKFILNSAPGKGCEIIVEIPLDK